MCNFTQSTIIAFQYHYYIRIIICLKIILRYIDFSIESNI